MIDFEQASYPAKVHPFEIEDDRLLPDFFRVAMMSWLGRVDPSTLLH
jgi:hypothetical protein